MIEHVIGAAGDRDASRLVAPLPNNVRAGMDVRIVASSLWLDWVAG